MNFSWDDMTRIYPVWPVKQGQYPTIIIPSTQKNGKNEEVPMLPNLRKLLESVPLPSRQGFVVNPMPPEYDMKSQAKKWFMPGREDLADLVQRYSNCAVARACGVSEQTVRNWLSRVSLQRTAKIACYGSEVPPDVVDDLRQRSTRSKHQKRLGSGRMTGDRVSKIIAQIGEEAKIIVRQPDKEIGRRIKYA